MDYCPANAEAGNRTARPGYPGSVERQVHVAAPHFDVDEEWQIAYERHHEPASFAITADHACRLERMKYGPVSDARLDAACNALDRALLSEPGAEPCEAPLACATAREPMPASHVQLPSAALPTAQPRVLAAAQPVHGVLKLEGTAVDIAALVKQLLTVCPPPRAPQAVPAAASATESVLSAQPSGVLRTDMSHLSRAALRSLMKRFGRVAAVGGDRLFHARQGFSLAARDGSPLHIQRVLLDSGASISLIQRTLAERLGLPIRASSARLNTASGRAAVVGSVDLQLQVSAGQHPAQLSVTALVIDGSDHLFSLLLGLPVLCALLGALDFAGPQPHFSFATLQLLASLEGTQELQRASLPLQPAAEGVHAGVSSLFNDLAAAAPLLHAFVAEGEELEELDYEDVQHVRAAVLAHERAASRAREEAAHLRATEQRRADALRVCLDAARRRRGETLTKSAPVPACAVATASVGTRWWVGNASTPQPQQAGGAAFVAGGASPGNASAGPPPSAFAPDGLRAVPVSLGYRKDPAGYVWAERPDADELMAGHDGSVLDTRQDPGDDEPPAAQQRTALANRWAFDTVQHNRAALRDLPVPLPQPQLISDLGNPDAQTLRLNTSLLSHHFYEKAKSEGVVLIELGSAAATGAEALLRAGFAIRRTYVSRLDPAGERILRTRLAHLRVEHEGLLHARATTPLALAVDDEGFVSVAHLRAQGTSKGEQWIVVATGEVDSHTMQLARDLLGKLQRLQPHLPPGYLLRATGATDGHALFEDAVMLDEALFGRGHHVVAAYATNLAAPQHLRWVVGRHAWVASAPNVELALPLRKLPVCNAPLPAPHVLCDTVGRPHTALPPGDLGSLQLPGKDGSQPAPLGNAEIARVLQLHEPSFAAARTTPEQQRAVMLSGLHVGTGHRMLALGYALQRLYVTPHHTATLGPRTDPTGAVGGAPPEADEEPRAADACAPATSLACSMSPQLPGDLGSLQLPGRDGSPPAPLGNAEIARVLQLHEPSFAAARTTPEQQRAVMLSGLHVGTGHRMLALGYALQRLYVTPHHTATLGPRTDPTGAVGGATSLACSMSPQLSPFAGTLGLAEIAAVAEAAELAELGATMQDVWKDRATLLVLRNSAEVSQLSAADYKRGKKRAQSYTLTGTALRRRMPDATLRVVPAPDERRGVIEACHRQLGHFGQRRTLALVQLGYWWYGMALDVRRVVAECKYCDQANTTGNVVPEKLQPLPVRGPFYRWGCDLLGPLPVTEGGSRFIMVCIEHYTKHIELCDLEDKRAETTARAFLECVLSRFSAPAEVLTDGGSEWQGAFDALLQQCLIDHRVTSPNHPQADGAAERVVQIVKKALRKLCAERGRPDRWDEDLPWIALGYRCSTQSATGFSPYQLLYGVAPVVPPAICERVTESVDFASVTPDSASA